MSKNQEKKLNPIFIIIGINVVLAGFIWFSAWIGTVQSEQRYEQEQSIVQLDTQSGNAPRERLVTLKDGREVLCLDWDGSLSCDWENAK